MKHDLQLSLVILETRSFVGIDSDTSPGIRDEYTIVARRQALLVTPLVTSPSLKEPSLLIDAMRLRPADRDDPDLRANVSYVNMGELQGTLRATVPIATLDRTSDHPYRERFLHHFLDSIFDVVDPSHWTTKSMHERFRLSARWTDLVLDRYRYLMAGLSPDPFIRWAINSPIDIAVVVESLKESGAESPEYGAFLLHTQVKNTGTSQNRRQSPRSSPGIIHKIDWIDLVTAPSLEGYQIYPVYMPEAMSAAEVEDMVRGILRHIRWERSH